MALEFFSVFKFQDIINIILKAKPYNITSTTFHAQLRRLWFNSWPIDFR